jgi:hypothetical protein
MNGGRLLAGTAVLIVLSVILGYFAQTHRPFSDTDHPFAYAYLAIVAVLAVVIFLVRWFVRL